MRVRKLERDYLFDGRLFFSLPLPYIEATVPRPLLHDTLVPAFVCDGNSEPELCTKIASLRTLLWETKQALRASDSRAAEAKLEDLDSQCSYALDMYEKVKDALYDLIDEFVPRHNCQPRVFNHQHPQQKQDFRNWMSCVPENRQAIDLGIMTLDTLISQTIEYSDDSVFFHDTEETLHPPTPTERSPRSTTSRFSHDQESDSGKSGVDPNGPPYANRPHQRVRVFQEEESDSEEFQLEDNGFPPFVNGVRQQANMSRTREDQGESGSQVSGIHDTSPPFANGTDQHAPSLERTVEEAGEQE